MTDRNIETEGRGCWYLIHLLCLKGDAKTALDTIRVVKENFFCEKCRKHFSAFVDSHPPGENLFNWSVDAHNAVNIRRRKRILTYDEALALFEGEDARCTSDCGGPATPRSAGSPFPTIVNDTTISPQPVIISQPSAVPTPGPVSISPQLPVFSVQNYGVKSDIFAILPTNRRA